MAFVAKRCLNMLQFSVLLLFLACNFNNVFSYEDPSALNIAAFNVQVFGITKMKKAYVVDALVKIISQYDVILIQEIRDSSGVAIQHLLQEIYEERKVRYNLYISERLGRTNSKEQYAFLCRENQVTIEEEYQYPDPKDVFERPPFAIKVSSPKTRVKTFVMVGVHISPQNVPGETDELRVVYDDVSSHFGTKNIIIAGDFSFGCGYMTVGERADSKVAHDTRFHWLIDDAVDTTVAASSCPYDRILVAGKDLIAAVPPQSAGVFRFDSVMGLDNDQARKVSDHYPVFFQIAPARDIADKETKEKPWKEVRLFQKISYVSTSTVERAEITAKPLGFQIHSISSNHGDVAFVQMKKSVIGKEALMQVFFNIYENLDIVTIAGMAEGVGFLDDHASLSPIQPYDVMIDCDVRFDTSKCTFRVQFS